MKRRNSSSSVELCLFIDDLDVQVTTRSIDEGKKITIYARPSCLIYVDEKLWNTHTQIKTLNRLVFDELT